MDVFAEGGVYLRGETGLIDTFLFVNDGGVFWPFLPAVLVVSCLLVSLPLLLF